MPVKPVAELDGFELKLGKRHYHFKGSETPFNNNCSAQIAADKYCTNKLLEIAGIPVPKAISLHASEFSQETIKHKIKDLKFPLVLKPLLNGARGIDVLCNIQNFELLLAHLETYFYYYDSVILEEFHAKLQSYRVLVFKRQVIGVVLRVPATVVGDGKHTIKELVERTNARRAAISDALGPILIDDECQIKLQELGIAEDTIPTLGERIALCYTSNATRGGEFVSLGKKICKENKRLMVRIASLLNLDFAGIDVECLDINQPLNFARDVIIEVNHRPSIRIHEFPIQGKPNLVTRKIVRSFIFRHPLSYLYALYFHEKTALMFRSLLLIILIESIYLLAKN